MLCFLFFSFYLSSPESSCIHLFTIHTFVFSSIHRLQCFYHVCPPLTFSVLFLILLCFHLCSLSLVFFSTHTLMITLFSLVLLPFVHLSPPSSPFLSLFSTYALFFFVHSPPPFFSLCFSSPIHTHTHTHILFFLLFSFTRLFAIEQMPFYWYDHG